MQKQPSSARAVNGGGGRAGGEGSPALCRRWCSCGRGPPPLPRRRAASEATPPRTGCPAAGAAPPPQTCTQRSGPPPSTSRSAAGTACAHHHPGWGQLAADQLRDLPVLQRYNQLELTMTATQVSLHIDNIADTCRSTSQATKAAEAGALGGSSGGGSRRACAGGGGAGRGCRSHRVERDGLGRDERLQQRLQHPPHRVQVPAGPTPPWRTAATPSRLQGRPPAAARPCSSPNSAHPWLCRIESCASGATSGAGQAHRSESTHVRSLFLNVRKRGIENRLTCQSDTK